MFEQKQEMRQKMPLWSKCSVDVRGVDSTNGSSMMSVFQASVSSCALQIHPALCPCTELYILTCWDRNPLLEPAVCAAAALF